MNLKEFLKNNKVRLVALSLTCVVPATAFTMTACGSQDSENLDENTSNISQTESMENEKVDLTYNGSSENKEVNLTSSKSEDNLKPLEEVVKDEYLREDFLKYLNGVYYDPERNADALGYIITYLTKYTLNNGKNKFLKISDYVESSRTKEQLELIENKFKKIATSKESKEFEQNYNCLEKLLESLNTKDGQMTIGDSARSRYKEIYAHAIMAKAASLQNIKVVEKIDNYINDARVNYEENGTDDPLYPEEVCGKTR